MLWASSTDMLHSLSLNKCIHCLDSHSVCRKNAARNSYGIFLNAEPCWVFTLQETNKQKKSIYVIPILLMSHARCCGKIRNSIWQAMIGEADAGDKTDMTGWKQLGRRSHWNTNQSMLSKATSHPINWHSLFRKIIYPSQIPPRRQLCVCACMCSKMCVVC